MSDLPQAPSPADADLRDFAFMPIDIVRLFGSTFHARADDAEWRAGVTLWLKSYHQVPAGSLPKDDIELCRLAELGRDLKTWRTLKAKAMHGWWEASDGRLYHTTIAEKVNEAWRRKGEHKMRTLKARITGLEKRLAEAVTDDERQHIQGMLHPLRQSLSQARTRSVTDPPTDPVTETNRQGQGQGQGQGQIKIHEEANASVVGAIRPPAQPCAEVQAYELWNAAAARVGRWPVCRQLDDSRRKALKGCLARHGGLEGFRELLGKAEGSGFLRDDMRAFGLDWLLKPANSRKVIEGNYDGRNGPLPTAKSSRGNMAVLADVVQGFRRQEVEHEH